jgi:hypothetical protein
MRLQWNVAHIGRKEVYTQGWWGNLKERVYLEDQGRDCRLILKYNFIP